MQTGSVQHYIRRAKDFLEGVQVLRDDPSYHYSCALLAIHSAIAYTDALRTGLGDSELTAEDHHRASTALQRILTARQVKDRTGFVHLDYLLSRKTLVAYGDRRIEGGIFDKIVVKAQRFAAWANHCGSDLHLEGWRE